MTQLDKDAETAFRLPVGAFSPLWLVFAGAAAAGAAFYWSRQWLKPVNLEAETPLPEAAPVEAPAEIVAEAAEAVVEPVIETAADIAEPVAEALSEIVEEAAVLAADDLTKLTGVGPKLAAALADRGVTRFADIAGWTEDDVARLDKDLKLMGRVEREAWIAQAKRLADTTLN